MTIAGPLGEKRGMMSHKLGYNGGKAGITDATVASGRSELFNDRDANECGFEGTEQGVNTDELLAGELQPENPQVRKKRFVEGVKPQNREHLRK